MVLDLSHDEAVELKKAIDIRVSELLNELAHTDDREYRTSVRSSTDVFEQLQARLGRLLELEDAVA